MAAPFDFQRRTFAARVADLGFSVDLPSDWIAHDLPPSDDDFSDPTRVVLLAVVTAPHAAVVLTVGARPAYDDGTVHEWATYLLERERMRPRAIGLGQLGARRAVVGEAMQRTDAGEIVVRFAFVEDGGRLLDLTLRAAAPLAPTIVPVWMATIRSFALASPRGQTVALHPDLLASAPPPQRAEIVAARATPQPNVARDAAR